MGKHWQTPAYPSKPQHPQKAYEARRPTTQSVSGFPAIKLDRELFTATMPGQEWVAGQRWPAPFKRDPFLLLVLGLELASSLSSSTSISTIPTPS